MTILQQYYNSITMTILQQQQQHEQELESFRWYQIWSFGSWKKEINEVKKKVEQWRKKVGQ